MFAVWFGILAEASPPAADGNLFDGVMLSIVGVAVVFLALVLVWGGLELLRGILSQRRAATVVAAAPAPADPPVAEDGPVDGRTLAILTAAAVAALGPGVRIRRVRSVVRHPSSSWTGHGRIAVQSSHRFRK
ncbi:MAG: OadG family transporter subunit [Phycisphaerae bacterium]|jgi:hypothetical protein